MNVSIVLPCYNEEATIACTVADVAAWMEREHIGGEIIVVDDGSRDSTPSVLAGLSGGHPALRVVRHERNQGYGIAVRSGCDAAREEVIAFMDSDGQFHAEDIGRLLPHLQRYAFVTGRRRRRADPPLRGLLGKLLGILTWITFGLWVRDVNCGLKAFRRSLWPDIRPEHGVEKLFNTEMFLRLKRRNIPWMQVDVPHYPRLAGTPTGAKFSVIVRMFRELWALRRA
ncbi:MAG: cell wall biosynthesis glycosyltransferase [Candidatus Peregrinibacteria bacterium Gr01-1014_25]|nr:MAG: cell wall biosynthesis glycosyltransferase [Candidatus Peregrinibacteria bacterium Gr01-1014_25]